MAPIDFVVVGAGIAGASVAWQLAGRASVLVLERESQPGYHSTGRSAALFLEHYGPSQVQALTRASRAFYSSPPADFMPGPVLSPRGALYVARADQRAQLEAAYAEARLHSQAVRWLERDGLLALVPCLRAQVVEAGFLDENARDMEVHGLHQGFLRGLRLQGGHLRCAAEVVSLAPDPAQGCWRIDLADGSRIAARHVVDAAGAWADALAALAGIAPLGLVPKRRSAFTFAAPAGVDTRHWPAVMGVDDSFYFKPDAGQMLGSPANADPTTPHDVVPEEIDVATGIFHIEQYTTLQIRRPSHTWAGLRSFVADGELVIGWDAPPEPGRPGFFWLAAQGGYGIQTAYAAGLLARNLLLGEALDMQLQAQGVQAERLSPARLR
ncbi:NAD(P)/FAD-dependent oxidoreductase [Comamonas endophytica]|uniref:FAD-binding oxidoreductase n=1 Tax=Comamonas endophytica TaxID=2949090 RepID=A0ABY6G5C4_9BURK|nr:MULTISPECIES: FAD-dependent oxidoreductase [unclassified Acidovorax]MCD2512347.1 FAD-binding oxidoreductase [Acidovorax sp. D4N7]UYG50203.1 FAD-binding oxidoreductase [Acidovorax sp. 5MLIR]